MVDQTNTIEDPTRGDEQLEATVRSLRAMPIEEETITPPSIEEIRAFLKKQNKDIDNQEKKSNGERVANYYFGRLQLLEMKDYLKKRFPENWKDKFSIVENFTKSVSSQLSTIYKKSPKRDPKAIRGAEVSEDEITAQDDLIDFVYKRGAIDKTYQEIERFAKWARSVLVRVQWQPQNKKIKLKPYPPQFWDVMVSDSGVLRAVIISDWVPKNGETQDQKERRYWVWTTELNGLRLTGPDFSIEPDPDQKINEMGIIPFVLFNDEIAVENEKPYLHPDIMLQNTNLAINKILTDGMAAVEIQTYGVPFMIGGDPESIPDQSGPQVFMHFPKSPMDNENPEVGILQPKVDFDGMLKFIERVANGYGTSRGLAPDSFSAEKSGSPQSGISLTIKKHNLVEMRDSEEAKYDELENELFVVIREVHNFQANRENGHELDDISDKVELSLVFPDSNEAFENKAENQRQGLSEVTAGLLKPSDFVRRRFMRKNQEEAVTYLKEVQEEKKELGLLVTLQDIDNTFHEDDETEETT